MYVQVISSVNEASTAGFHNKTAIIVDVLRATSTIITALSAGAASIIPAETVMEARGIHRPEDVLAGERFGRQIAGFELGNSPGQFTEKTVGGRRVIFTTTNGTRAIHKSMKADYIITASLLNASAAARTALELRRSIVILCAGSHDEFAIEDGLCAGLLLDRLMDFSEGRVETDDLGTAMLALYRNHASQVKETLMDGMTGRKLLKLGMMRDVADCSAIDVYSGVPRLCGDQLIL